MDPVTAIGLASAVISFIEFSWGLVRGAEEVYRSPSGVTADNASLTTIIADLKDAASGIRTDLQGRNKHEQALVALACDCEAVSKELLQILSSLKRHDESKRQAIKVTLRSIRKEKKILSIEKRLSEFRSEIVFRLNMILW